MNHSERGLVLPRAALVFVCFLPMACSFYAEEKVYPVRGEVFYNGQPAAGAVVHFHPLDEERTPAFAEVNADGSFELSTHGTNDGAEEGDYVVTVNWRTAERIDGETIESDDLLGGRYSKRETSTLKATVNAGETVVPRFDLNENSAAAQSAPAVVAPRANED